MILLEYRKEFYFLYCIMKITNKILSALVIIGSLNWGFIGLGYFLDMNLNIVQSILSGMPMLEALIYIIVGFACIFLFLGNKK